MYKSYYLSIPEWIQWWLNDFCDFCYLKYILLTGSNESDCLATYCLGIDRESRQQAATKYVNNDKQYNTVPWTTAMASTMIKRYEETTTSVSSWKRSQEIMSTRMASIISHFMLDSHFRSLNTEETIDPCCMHTSCRLWLHFLSIIALPDGSLPT